ncbi:glycosyltransferase family 4 protein [Butyrivibrio sp. NC3005]|uniref:glycosyltransferase family 4 protein n=1 Tax=Butyrivibrio sp. NC3005 TaxID=1280685 RepID=UPI00041129D4|nr:glycosyltransferase family 4 protein [Butyrivibrio sp. NC3005]
MQFLFISNYINHHQIPLCNELYQELGDDFIFMQTQPMEEERIKMGWGQNVKNLPYVRMYMDNIKESIRLIENADVVLLGWTEDADVRNKCLQRPGDGKLLLRMSERIYREGRWKAISPKGLISKYREHIRFRKKNVYMLCNGAYVAGDFSLIGAYPDKMLKWGYFPELKEYSKTDIYEMKKDNKVPYILWTGRYMKGVKHPEFAVLLARYLKEKGYKFRLDMIGDGEQKEEVEAIIKENNLGDYVKLLGFLPPDEVRTYMEKADIYLFTSNHLEGWGAVVNEAMNSACAVVAGSDAGAVPYLIKDGENGLIYEGENIEQFFKKVEMLINSEELRKKLGKNAFDTIYKTWNAKIAARRLVRFSNHLLHDTPYEKYTIGPLSKA